MAPNFSNQGVHTFDPDNDYLGLRLQQGVPLLDRDWNELNDIRVHLDRMLRRMYLGEGVPDLSGFEVGPLGSGAADDVLIGPGNCLVDGYDVTNRNVVAFSEQGDLTALPAARRMTLYLLPEVVEVDSVDEPELGNPQDINIETCVRDRLTWAVRAVAAPAIPPPNAYPLAEIDRDQAATAITEEHIRDLRRTQLNLATTVDNLQLTADMVETVRAQVADALDRIEEMQRDLDRIFWQVRVTPSRRSALFGSRVGIDIQVTDRRGTPIQGAHIGFSTDWGTVSLASSVTDADGRVSAELVGVNNDVSVRASDIASLDSLSTRVQGAMVRPTGVAALAEDEIAPIAYASLQFAPHELELMSRYTPTATVVDLTNDLPRLPEVALPTMRTSTVSVYVKESPFDSIVKASGNVQVRFGEWVRPWMRTKLWQMIDGVSVTARVGDLIRQGVSLGGGELDTNRVVRDLMPAAFGEITQDTTRQIKHQVFGDEGLADYELRGSGKLGQALAEELTGAIGAKTQQAIAVQLTTLVQTDGLAEDRVVAAEQELTTGSSQIVAGMAQRQKQLFARVEV